MDAGTVLRRAGFYHRAYRRGRPAGVPWLRVAIFAAMTMLPLFLVPPIVDALWAPRAPMASVLGMRLAVIGALGTAAYFVAADTCRAARMLSCRRLGGRACRGCGYDLRGLDTDAACPECSKAAPAYTSERKV
jgi:hypothetical protein